MNSLQYISRSLLQVFFPHLCTGCGSDLLEEDHHLCLQCYSQLPFTGYEMHNGNPVEKIFWGRVPVTSATASFYFSKGSLMQQLIHELKYKQNKEIGIFLGKLMGESMVNSHRFMDIDALIPLPLFADKERKRGYNQATLLCEGMSAVLKLPIIRNNVQRQKFTETQTRKGRAERWDNVAGSFVIKNASEFDGRHVLLVDDVITTGATLEACGNRIVDAGNCRLSVAALAIASS